ncbi:MAG: dihydroorotate dehydrogenase electron transfer subunit [Oscillibacter sp.]|jgi:dihydroorotate dehydrogenase electron transfer subunit|nr:dihydroorotate dehydrogenase electron transfer subunit [Oscillibacter sp.]
MQKTVLKMAQSRRLTRDVWEMVLEGDASAFTHPGQFLELSLPEKFLRRPISVASYTEDGVLLLVRAAGQGTRELVTAAPGTEFDTLTGLGNGFDLKNHGEKPILIGGGIGLAPLYGLARKFVGGGLFPTVVLGFRSAADVFYVEDFTALGCRVFVATEDGSLGVKGYVTDCIRSFVPECNYGYVCGPTPMLRAVSVLPQLSDGQFSFEARMACGFGACMGCSIHTVSGAKRVCKDGPVFQKGEIVW